MKTLDQWLADSDEDEDEENVQRDSSANSDDAHNASEDRHSSIPRVASGPSTSAAPSFTGSHVSAHTPTTLRPAEHPVGGIYTRQEETREKMRRLLGAEAVVKATTPTSSFASGGGGGTVGSGSNSNNSPTWTISAPPDRSHFSFGTTPNATQPTPQGPWTPPTIGNTGAGPTSVDASSAPDSSQLPEVEQTMKGLNVRSSGGGPPYAAVEVMVVDRGTQTVTSEGTQTEPMPINVGPFYTGPYMPVLSSGYAVMAGSAYGNYTMSPSLPLPPAHGFGVDGRPYRQYLYDYEKREAEEASRLREELGMIQNSIDMLIARYNLPPPPL